MIIKFLKIFSQNFHKNRLFINTILKNNKYFDILFIQEPPWLIIYNILSFTSEEEENIIGAPNHSS